VPPVVIPSPAGLESQTHLSHNEECSTRFASSGCALLRNSPRVAMQTSRVYGGSPVTVELSETREVYHGSQFPADLFCAAIGVSEGQMNP
jgi:hypothetical protein